MPSPIPDRLRSLPSQEPPQENQGRLRFSLRTLLIVLTISSFLMATLIAFPAAFATGTLVVVFQVIPLVLLMGIIWGGKYTRAFCLGAIIPAALTLFTLAPMWVGSMLVSPWNWPDDYFARVGEMLDEFHGPYRVIAALSWIFSLLLGLIALVLRRLVFRGGV